MEHHIKNGDQIMFNTNSAHKAILCPKNFLIVLTALVCFLSSAVVSAQEARMLSGVLEQGFIPGNSCDAGLTVPSDDRSNCIEIHADNLDTVNTTNISRARAPDSSLLVNSNPEQEGYLGIIDWVVVELRVVNQGQVAPDVPNKIGLNTTNRPGLIVFRQPALLRSDGTIINADAEDLLAPDAVLTLAFEGFDDSTQDAYIVIEHRTHIGLMSSSAVTPDEEYNFGSSDDQFFGESTNGANPADNPLKSPVWSAIAGNLNGDAEINDSDTSLAREQGELGYVADTNLDGDINDDETTFVRQEQGAAPGYTPCRRSEDFVCTEAMPIN